MYGHTDILSQVLLSRGGDIEAGDQYGETLLSRAARYGHEAVVKLLLDEGASVGSKDSHGHTPLSRALTGKHGKIEELLRQRGANLEAIEECSRMSLCKAAEIGGQSNIS